MNGIFFLNILSLCEYRIRFSTNLYLFKCSRFSKKVKHSTNFLFLFCHYVNIRRYKKIENNFLYLLIMLIYDVPDPLLRCFAGESAD